MKNRFFENGNQGSQNHPDQACGDQNFPLRNKKEQPITKILNDFFEGKLAIRKVLILCHG
jgi:hypothetical protein